MNVDDTKIDVDALLDNRPGKSSIEGVLESVRNRERERLRERLLKYGQSHFADDYDGWEHCAKVVFGDNR